MRDESGQIWIEYIDSRLISRTRASYMVGTPTLPTLTLGSTLTTGDERMTTPDCEHADKVEITALDEPVSTWVCTRCGAGFAGDPVGVVRQPPPAESAPSWWA